MKLIPKHVKSIVILLLNLTWVIWVGFCSASKHNLKQIPFQGLLHQTIFWIIA